MNAGHPLAQNMTNTEADCFCGGVLGKHCTDDNDNDRGIAMAKFFHDRRGDFWRQQRRLSPPVVDFVNYQNPLGQIRTNQFVDSPWELRGFRTDLSTGVVTLEPDTIEEPAHSPHNDSDPMWVANPTYRQNF